MTNLFRRHGQCVWLPWPPEYRVISSRYDACTRLCFRLIDSKRLFSFATGFPRLSHSTLAWKHLDRSQKLYSRFHPFIGSALIVTGRRVPEAIRSRPALPEYVQWRREFCRERCWQPEEPSSSFTTEPILGKSSLGHAHKTSHTCSHKIDTQNTDTHIHPRTRTQTNALTCTVLLPGARI
jgi:hypothetical protein